MAGTSFFGGKIKTGTQAQAVKPQKRFWVNVGGLEDSAFRAAAVAMIDNVLLKPKANQELAKYLIELHKKHFEQQQIPSNLLTSAERLAKLVEAPISRARFISELSFALRQETVREMRANPWESRSSFLAVREGIAPESMRQSGAHIDEDDAMRALAKAAKIKIEVQVVEPEKKGRGLRKYNHAQTAFAGSPITMQLQNESFLPQVANNPNFFASTNIPVAVKPKLIEEQDPALADILSQIAQEISVCCMNLSKTQNA